MVDELKRSNLIESIWDLFQRRKWIFILAFIPVFVISVSIINSLPSLYRSSAKLLVGQEDIFKSFVTSGLDQEYVQRLGLIQQSLLSRRQLSEIIEKFDLYPGLRSMAPQQVVVNRMRRDIEIRQESAIPQSRQNTTIQLKVSYQTWDPELAAVVANELTTLIRQENQDIKIQQANRTTEFLSQQLDEVRGKLAEQEQRMEAFQEENLNALPQQQDMNISILERLDSELKTIRDQQIELRNILSGRNSNSRTAASGETTPTERLSNLRYQLSTLRNRYTGIHPEIIRLQNEITTLENEIAEGNLPGVQSAREDSGGRPEEENLRSNRNREAIQAELRRLQEQENNLVQQIREVEHRIEYAPQVERELQRMSNEYNQVREEFVSLQKRYQDARILESLENQENQQIRVLEAAIPPAFPAAPGRLKLQILALMGAGMFAGALVFLFEQVDNSFHSINELRAFTAVPVMASLHPLTHKKEAWASAVKNFILLILVVSVTLYLASLASSHAESAIGIVWQMADRGL